MATGTADARAALPPALAEALAGYEEHLRAQRRPVRAHGARIRHRRRVAARPPGTARWGTGARPRPRRPARLARPGARPRAQPGDDRAPRGLGAVVHRLPAAQRAHPGGRRAAAGQPQGAPDAPRRAGAGPGARGGRVIGGGLRAGRAARRGGARAALRQRHPGERARRPRRRRRRSRAAAAPGSRQGPQGAERALRAAGRARRRRLADQGAPGARDRPVRTARCCWVRGVAGSTPGRPAGSCTRPSPRRRVHRTSGPTGCGTPPPRMSSRVARTSGPSRSCWVTLASRRRRSTRT